MAAIDADALCEGYLASVTALMGEILREEEGRFLIRWEGYGPEDDTWEPEANVSPALVLAFRQARARMAAGDTSRSLKAAEVLLSSWDRQYTRVNTGARLFETAVGQTTALLYDEFIPAKSNTRAVTPSESRLLQLLADSANGWWDDRRTTAVREDRNVILATALRTAYDTLVAEYGDPATTPWTWGRVAPAKPNHLLRLAGFAAPEMPIDGGRGTLNPSVGSKRANFGASWRMVVEMDKEPRVHAVYPGGQSGNPASTRYLDRYAMWANGQLDSVRTPRSAKDLAALDTRAVLTLTR
jgi:penicillin amidase